MAADGAWVQAALRVFDYDVFNDQMPGLSRRQAE